MGSSLYLDDSGKITINKQVSETRFKKIIFKVSDLSHFTSSPPGMFRNGTLEFHFIDGRNSESVTIPSGNKKLFSQLVKELDEGIKTSSRKAQSPINQRSTTQNEKFAKAKVVKKSNSAKALDEEFSNSFVSVDIEWADSSDHFSICEIGVALFENGNVTRTYKSYVRPASDYMIGIHEQRTHGIHDELITRAKTFSEQWEEIVDFFGDYPLVLHNATNDVNKILGTLAESGVKDIPDFDYLDAMLIARKLPWVTARSGVDDLADFFGLDREYATYDNRTNYSPTPHGALEDAIVTGKIFLNLLELCGYSNPHALVAAISGKPGQVRSGAVKNGFSAPGKLPFKSVSELPEEAQLMRNVQKTKQQAKRLDEKRSAGESAKAAFLAEPNWSTIRLEPGQTVCFTQFMNWDDHGNDHRAQVEQIAVEAGFSLIGGVRSDLDLLVVNDPWVADSAKLRDALGRKVPIPVTIYSVFQKDNPGFPDWEYLNSEQYEELKSQGLWPNE
jgi:DNA polymerase-3 subunit epsilon